MRAVGNSVRGAPLLLLCSVSANQMACMAAACAHTPFIWNNNNHILQFASSYDKYFQCRNPIIRFCAWLRAAFTILWSQCMQTSIYKHNATSIHTAPCRFFGPFACTLLMFVAILIYRLFSFSATHADTVESGLMLMRLKLVRNWLACLGALCVPLPVWMVIFNCFLYYSCQQYNSTNSG
jgi:hypothetical protein